MPVRTVSQKFSHLQWRRLSKQLWDWPTTTADFGSPFRQVPYTSNLHLLEDKVQDRGMYLFTIPYGSDAMDKKWSWLIQWMIWDLRRLLVVFQCLILKYLMRGLLQHWTKSSIIPTSKEEAVWRNERPRSRTVSFAVDRFHSWSTITSGSLGGMILSKTTQTCSQVFFEMTIFRNSILSGTEFYYQSRKSHLMTFWKDCKKLRKRESDKLKTVLELYDLETHQKNLEIDYHRLKTVVKRSIEQEISK